MQKRTLFLVVGLAMLVMLSLSACASKATPPPATATPTTEPSPTAALPSPTPTELAPTELAPTETAVLVDVPSGCSTYALLPTPEASTAEIFPASQAGDWEKGAKTASITIIEYSDFQ